MCSGICVGYPVGNWASRERLSNQLGGRIGLVLTERVDCSWLGRRRQLVATAEGRGEAGPTTVTWCRLEGPWPGHNTDHCRTRRAPFWWWVLRRERCPRLQDPAISARRLPDGSGETTKTERVGKLNALLPLRKPPLAA